MRTCIHTYIHTQCNAFGGNCEWNAGPRAFTITKAVFLQNIEEKKLKNYLIMLWIYSNYLLISTLSRKTIKFHIFSLLIWWSRTDEEKKHTDHADRLLLTHFNMSDLSIFRLISALFIEREQILDIKLWKKIFAIIFAYQL